MERKQRGKRLWLIIATVVLVVLACFTLVACGGFGGGSGSTGGGSGNTGGGGDKTPGIGTGGGNGDHKHEYINYVYNNDATCGHAGTETGKCKYCDETDTITSKRYPATGDHSFGTYVYDDNATCVDDGTETAECANCDEKDTRTSTAHPKTGIHTFKTYKPDNNATCVDAGTETAKCEYCKETDTRDVDGEPNGKHSYDNGVCEHCGAIDPDAPATEGLKYTAIYDRGTVIGYSVEAGTAKDNVYIKIPATYNEKPVTTITYTGFNNCANLTTLEIPSSITKSESGAFERCYELENVYFTGDIEDWCGITFGDHRANPVSITHSVYIDGEKLTELVIPDAVTEIGDYLFYGCTSITSLVLHDAVTSIGSYAFNGCKKITELDIPESVETIESGAFSETGLTSVVIPDSVTKLGSTAFGMCTSLTSVVIGNQVWDIEMQAFFGCSKLTTVTIPKSVTWLRRESFCGCWKLAEIKYDGTVEEWRNISKGYQWDLYTGAYVVICDDGTLDNNGQLIEE
ncbi:MAG: leucine-rich repeat domain-containing protein [Clostridiales bacterium]|nr:leucine-rich repeat domain-containing protein [Clostridiales bacterium]